jgi:hypothetical protein
MDNTHSKPLDRATHYGLIIIAVAQGYALYFLHLALSEDVWPSTDLRWLKALYTVAVGLPAFFYLGIDHLQNRRNYFTAAALAVVLFVLGWHLGWMESTMGLPTRYQHEFTPAFLLSLGVALFILAFFYRAWSAGGHLRFGYRQLLEFSWEQALTLGLLALFVLAFWLLLWLWAGLFDAIGVGFFKELFEEPAFIYPVTWLVLGFGLVLIRNRIRLVATVQFMCEALIKALLPLAALIVVLFLSTLPFTGLQPIWDTGNAAFLMMALTLVLLFFFNAVLGGDIEQPPYPLPVRLFVLLAVALLPVSTLLAVWALWLRIDQYGLTPDRLWAGVILLLTAGYTFSYAVLILWKRTQSVRHIQTANKWLALMIVCVMVLVNTPVADLRAWSAQSQAERLLSGEVDVEKFDYAYMRFSLGAYGVRALREIEASEFATDKPEIAKRIAAAMAQKNRWSDEPIVDKNDLAAVAELISVVPADTTLPEDLLKLIIDDQRRCLNATESCRAIKLPGADDGADWLLLRKAHGHCSYGAAYVQRGDQWLKMGSLSTSGCCEEAAKDSDHDEIPTRIPGPFLAYTGRSCLYSITADKDYLRGLVPQAVPGVADDGGI